MPPAADRTEWAPAAIHAVYDHLAAADPTLGLHLGGIVGDQAHVYGYHRARAVLPPDDYSVVHPLDQVGPPWAASAIDLTPSSSVSLRILTRRLRAAVARGDTRITRVVREFYGTIDGEHVYGWDLATNRPSTSDTSHLWHLHISFYRRYACRARLLALVADVLATPLRLEPVIRVVP